jgi:hypothetical protein
VPLLPLGSFCLLQTILLSDLVGCDSLLQIVIIPWHTSFKFEARQTAITISRGLLRLTQQVQILKKVRQTAILSAEGCHTQLDGAALPSGNISQCFFSRAEKPSEEINSPFIFDK